jgi:hypothetical protein
LLPQNSDFDAGSIAVLIPTKHNMAKINPVRNVGARFLIALTAQPIFLVVLNLNTTYLSNPFYSVLSFIFLLQRQIHGFSKFF